jgi:DNA-binding CsgD family transcriptional regulator
VQDLVGGLAEGRGGALIVRGEAGAGKSALLEAALLQAATLNAGALNAGAAAGGRAARVAAGGRGRAPRVQVLSTAGVEPETGISFAGLHRLLQPALHRVDGLPPRQRTALLAAFGLADSDGAERLLIGLAMLELVGNPPDGTATLLVIDDAHLLDEPSCAVLSFAARRLDGRPCGMLVTARDGHRTAFDEAGLNEVQLGQLSDSSARALLHNRAPDLPASVRERIIDQAAGNPLALVELPAALPATLRSADPRTGSTTADGTGTGQEQPPVPALSGRLPLTPRLERAFTAQAAIPPLPPTTRTLLLVAACDESAVLGEVLSAARVVAGETGGGTGTVTIDALSPAIEAKLVDVHRNRLAFRHPLMCSATYQAASLAGRQAAHAALAQVLAGQPDRQVWHRAAAALGPDEQVAAALDATAERAGRRGAVGLAATALERAAELSDGEARRGGRLLRAAEMAFDAGHSELGPQLLQAAEPLDLPTEERTWLSWLRQSFPGGGWPAGAKVGSFIAMADRMRVEGHPALAAESLHTAALRCWWGNPDRQTRAAVVAAAERIPLPPDQPAMLAVLACADPVRRGAVVADLISGLTPDAGDPAGMYLVGTAATAVWAYDLSLPFLEQAVHGLRAQGRRGLLAQALVSMAWTSVHLARGSLAESAAQEATQLARESGQLRWAISAQLALAAVAAEQGDADSALAVTRDAEAQLTSAGPNPMLALVQFVRGRSAVAHQHYEEGAGHLRRALDPADPAYHPFIGAWGLADLVEASAHTGELEAADGYLADLESLAAQTRGRLLLAQAGYARPMTAADDDAESLYQAALDRDLMSWPGFRSRMLLWYGRWLRRQRRIAESRAPLRAASDSSGAINFQILNETAQQELRASGERHRRRAPESWDQLTAQELKIARLAADGLSNREIGQQLYISHRTVGYHLHRIFPKLGISSRSQLHAAVHP